MTYIFTLIMNPRFLAYSHAKKDTDWVSFFCISMKVSSVALYSVSQSFACVGLVLATIESILSPFSIRELHWTHLGWVENAKLSLIHPLHSSLVHDHTAVISSG